jgi:hypothetical protein
MRLRLRIWTALLIALVPLTASAAPGAVTVIIDTRVADTVLAAATADAAQVPALTKRALAQPGLAVMIAKEHRYNPRATVESFSDALYQLPRGGNGEPFDLQRVYQQPQQVRALLRALRERRAELTARLAERLNAFAPEGLKLQATLVVVLGSHQNGWVPSQKTPVFYIDAGFQEGDVDSLIAVAAHELFHTVQGAVQPAWDAALAPAADGPPSLREAHNVHAAALNLVIEGMADYVGDPRTLPGEGAGMQQARRDYERALRRSTENFALIDTILYRFGSDPVAPLGQLLDVGFGGAWEQRGYFVGYVMAQAIDRYRGRERLRALVSLPPEEFVLDYIALCLNHPEDQELIRFSDATITALTASEPAGWHS